VNKPVLFATTDRTAQDGADCRSRTDQARRCGGIGCRTPAAVQLARAGSFVVAVPNEGEIDDQEAATARQIAEEGAAGARRRGYNASARIAQANESVAKTIDEIAQEIDARLVVCGQRGRGVIGSALLGSVSHALVAHTKRPVLIAPQHPS
jgi:nucleotide-binding universal stress UspA family protein